MMRDPHTWAQQPTNQGISCLLMGDINIQDRADPISAFRFIHKTLSDSDVLFGNLEGCLYRAGKNDLPDKSTWRHSDASMINALVSVGFSAVGCANNVMFGSEAILNTLRVLDEAGIKHCGAGTNRMAARMPIIMEKCGIRFGFIQLTARLHAKEQAASINNVGVAYFNPENQNDFAEISSYISELRSYVDILVFSHHVRKSGTVEIEPYQRDLAYRCINAGADIVYGHGAHVIQGIDIWKGVPIFHCVGELVFDYPIDHSRKEGLILRLLVEGRRITHVSFLLCCRDADNNVYLVDPLENCGRRQFNRLRELSPSVSLHVEGGEVVIAEDLKCIQ